MTMAEPEEFVQVRRDRRVSIGHVHEHEHQYDFARHDSERNVSADKEAPRTRRPFLRYDSTGHSGRRESMKNNLKKTFAKRFSIQISTEQHNRTDEEKFYGPYQHLRSKLDYKFHCRYRKERQWLHDSIIEEYLSYHTESSSFATEPWLIYTCGAKGSGKGYTIRTLVQECKLPLLSYVCVDADEIRRSLPEFCSYVENSPELVSRRMNKEAGYIAELLALAALQAGKNVILDGTLSDAEWHVHQFRKLRASYPSLKIALLHVMAPLGVIMKRSEELAKETRLHIPAEKFERVLEEIPHNVEAVKPVVDYHCTIRNVDPALELIDDTWENFTRTFTQEVVTLRESGKPQCTTDKVLQPGVKGQDIFVASTPTRKGLRRSFHVGASTEDNHQSEDRQFYGKYSHIRETLDYSYHQNYTFERQKFQDAVVTEFLHSAVITDKDGQLCTTPTEPWIVFTAGAMGAGKGYTMRKLVDKGLFPLLAFVNVDPDEIRRYLPEYHLYLDHSPELAGELTRKEAGYIAEILTLAGLQAGKNVIVDGSLRDSDWYQDYFARLRSECLNLRIGIIHVMAPRAAVFQRAAERALVTGRVVPTDVLNMALEQVPKSVEVLGPQADYFVEVYNGPDSTDIELVTEGETWENFKSKWVQACAWIPKDKKKLKSLSESLSSNSLRSVGSLS